MLKTVKVKRLKLENFKGKGTWHFQSDFGKTTKITGQNRCGKTSVLDGYMDILTSKLADGSQSDSIRPHDESGKNTNRLPVVREVELDVDGKTTVISKKTEQKWRKPRGQSEEVFDGNATTYTIDGFESKNQKDFQSFIEGIAPADTLLMCSNAQPFLTLIKKSTSEARKVLEGLTGFSVERFIAENPQYANITEITRNHPIEDALKQLRKNLTAQKKEMEKIRGNLEYEQSRNIDGIDGEEVESTINNLQEQIAELNKQEEAINEIAKAYDEASQVALRLQFDQGEVARQANASIMQAKSKAETELYAIREEKRKMQREQHSAEWDLEAANKRLETADSDLKQAQTDYVACYGSKYDTSKLKAIEAEEYTEEDTLCPTCGQKLPEDKLAKRQALWKKNKQKQINQELQAQAEFEEWQKGQVQAIIDRGKYAKADKMQAITDREEAEKRITTAKEAIGKLEEQIEVKSAAFDELPSKADLSQNAEYQRLQAQIAEQEAVMENMSTGSEKRSEIKAERDRLTSEKVKLEAKILKARADSEEKKQRVANLEKELKNQAQKMADIERDIDKLTNFSIEKNKALADVVNPNFHHFHFEFLTYTIEGNPQETLKLICNSCGTSYFDGLNGGDRRLVELDLCRGLQAMQNLSLPIWVDEASVIDDWRIPKIGQQLIILQRSNDKELKVEIVEKEMPLS